MGVTAVYIKKKKNNCPVIAYSGEVQNIAANERLLLPGYVRLPGTIYYRFHCELS